MVWLRLLHIVAGVVWVGSAVYIVLVLYPAARAAGEGGAAVLARVMPRTGLLTGVAMLLNIVPGFIMFGRLASGAEAAFLASPTGRALAAGAVATILAVSAGAAINGPAGAKTSAIRKTVAAQGGSATADQAAQLARLQRRSELGAQISAALLVLAAAAMAVARYL